MSFRFRHVDAKTGYGALRAAILFGRQQFGTPRSTKTMEEQIRARQPRPGEGENAGKDPYLGKTVQPDGLSNLPPNFLLEQHREGAAAFGTVLEEVKERIPQHDELIAEHLELSYDGETVSHEKLTDGIETAGRRSAYLAIVLGGVAALAVLGTLLGAYGVRKGLEAGAEVHELRREVQALRGAQP